MKIFRSEKNPIITPEDVKASRPGFKVVCVFNCGVVRFNGETLLLMRVAEAPVNNNPHLKLAPILDEKTGKLIVREFSKADPSIDFSDPRVIRLSEMYYLTSISHFRIARSKNGIDFEIVEKPAMFPENKYENIEDYIRLSIPVNFYTILEATSRKNDLAIGYKIISEENNSIKNFGIYLNPDKSQVINFSAGDSVIVLSEKK